MQNIKPSTFHEKIGRVQLFVNEHERKDGTPWYSATIKKPFFDKQQNEWRHGSFSKDDLDDLIKAAELAKSYMEKKPGRNAEEAAEQQTNKKARKKAA